MYLKDKDKDSCVVVNIDVVDMVVVVVVAADGDAVRVLPNQHRMVHRLACPAVSSYCNQDLVPKVVAVAYRNPTRQDRTFQCDQAFVVVDRQYDLGNELNKYLAGVGWGLNNLAKRWAENLDV